MSVPLVFEVFVVFWFVVLVFDVELLLVVFAGELVFVFVFEFEFEFELELLELAPFVPLKTILCIALYVSLEISSLDTTFPFNLFTKYVSVFNPLDPFCLTFSVPTAKLASSTYFVVYGIVEICFTSKVTSYSTSSFIPYIEIVAIPFCTDANIFIGYFLVFLNRKSVVPYTTVASLPAAIYEVTNW